jgi:signal peptidase I
MSVFSILGRVIVEGTSMQPTYNPRDWLLVYYGFSSKKRPLLRLGDAVLIEREQQPGIFYIKRIAEIKLDQSHQQSYFVRSDNESGVDSRTWGYLRSEEIVAKVVARIKRNRS